MTFLNGALLWFGLGGLIPIIIHLLHRQRYQRVRWAAMEFLLRAMRKTQRRIRLENLILLLIRILAMLLLAMAIAEPVLRSSALGGHTLTHCFVVIDNSYSMGYQPGQTPLLKQAKDLAKKLVIDEELAAFSQDDRISVLTLSDYPQNLTGSGINDKQQAKVVIESVELSDYGTSMLQTARMLTRLLEDPQWTAHRKKIFIVTDLQRSGWSPPGTEARTELAGHLKTLSKAATVVLVDVGAANPRNTASVGLTMLDPVAIAGRPVALAAELHNYSDEELPNAAVTLWAALDDGALEEKTTQTVFLPAGGSATAHFRHTFVTPGQARLKVELQSDRLNSTQGVDNARFLAVEVRESIRILCVDGEAGEGGAKKDETYFVVKALNPNHGREFRPTAKLDTFFDGSELDHDEVDILVLANVASLRPEVVARVEAFVARGGAVLIALGAMVDLPSYNEHLWKEGKGLLPASLKSIEGGGEGAAEYHFGAVDGAHPVFKRFVEIMMTALRLQTFQRFVRTEGHDPRNVAASFDDPESSPALLEKRFGEGAQAGRVMLFTSTLDHDWAEKFPGNNIYLVLVHEMMKHLASRPADERNLFIGDTIVHHLPAHRFGEFSIQLPSGPAPEPSRSDLMPGDAGFQIYFPGRPTPPVPGGTATPGPKTAAVNEGLSQAGFYVLMRHGAAGTTGTEVLASFAANVPPRFPSPEAIGAVEGNLERLAVNPDEAAPLADYPDFRAVVVSPERGGRATAEARIEHSGAWRLLVWILLGLLAVESLLAMLFGRRKA